MGMFHSFVYILFSMLNGMNWNKTGTVNMANNKRKISFLYSLIQDSDTDPDIENIMIFAK
jgi:hypothetical protein